MLLPSGFLEDEDDDEDEDEKDTSSYLRLRVLSWLTGAISGRTGWLQRD